MLDDCIVEGVSYLIFCKSSASRLVIYWLGLGYGRIESDVRVFASIFLVEKVRGLGVSGWL